MGARPVEGERPALVWFRDDLRLADNPALTAAAASGRPVIGLYLLDENPARRPLGGATRWWLHHSLDVLSRELAARGVPLILKSGSSADGLVEGVARQTDAAEVHWNRRYDEPSRTFDAAVKSALEAEGRAVHSHNGHLLVEPWQVRNKSGEPFRVFTPFWRAAQDPVSRRPAPLPVPDLRGAADPGIGTSLAALDLLPRHPDWAGGLRNTWTPGEAAARARLSGFLEHRVGRYADQRDLPAGEATSELSAHLRFGEISVGTVYAAAEHRADANPREAAAVAKFHSELGWREFAYHLLYHFPDLDSRNFQPRFDAFPWRDGADADREVTAWKRGLTGYPIVDAGMRQLWQTGAVHNRVRLIVASFLVKHLLVDWRVGEAWFWDTLVDADPASNPASWQWVAGSGADAAPYFRIFNPVAQGERFDPEGAYVKRWVPELEHLPPALIHKPWVAPSEVLRNLGVILGRTYPEPLVDHEAARGRALAAFDRLRPNVA